MSPQAALATRGRLGLAGLLAAGAVAAWWSTADRMEGMDAGPGTGLGSLGWFTGVWVVMMAAMMLPAVTPTVTLYARMAARRWPGAPLAFAGGYLLVWGGAGVVAFGADRLLREVLGGPLAWDAGGRWVAGATVLVAAVYEVTPLKHACLAKCRSPLGFLLGVWRDGPRGALEMGARHAAWCVGCCWALMAALFALGVMSIPAMALVAGIITVEKTLPWRRVALGATVAVLVVLGVLLMASPGSVPGLTVPGDDAGQMAPGGMMMR